ncbi:MAG: hemerythrin domain-containing protein [Ignavibacteriaceae bacterium]|nr:hemerythrin domain-containing protein [Ignavibacteriaceae bacterium]
MQSITNWDPRKKVGNDIIDNKHKELFDLIKDFKNAVWAGESMSIKEILLGVLLDYSFQHFETEEEYLKESADYTKHCLEHYILIKKLNTFIIDFRKNRTDEKIVTSYFFENWLKSHIERYNHPYFPIETEDMGLINKYRKIDKFNPDSSDRRRYKRISCKEVVNETIKTDCYNATHLRNGKATIINMSYGGLLLNCASHHDINDLLIINFKIGSNFSMTEKVRVKKADNEMHGVEFIAPSESTIDFITSLYGSVH